MSLRTVKMSELGCIDYWGGNKDGVTGADNAALLQAYLDDLKSYERSQYDGVLDLEGKAWSLAQTVFIPSLMSFRIEGGGGWLPRNYSMNHYSPATGTNASGLAMGQFLWTGDDRGTMFDYTGVGLEVHNVCFAGNPQEDHLTWDNGARLPSQAGVCFQTNKRVDGVGTGKIHFHNATFRHCDVGFRAGDGSVSNQNNDNCYFSGTTTFGNCNTAGFQTEVNQAVNYCFEYIRPLGASCGTVIWCADGGNFYVHRCEIIAPKMPAFLRVETTSNQNSCTFVMNDLKWDQTALPGENGPHIVHCAMRQSALNVVLRNAHLKHAPGDNVQLFRLWGGCRLLLDSCHNVSRKCVRARSDGPSNNRCPVVIAENCVHTDDPSDSIFMDPEYQNDPHFGGVYIWKGATIHGYTSTANALAVQDGERFEGPDVQIDRLSGNFMRKLPESDPGVEGAWYVDEGNFVRVSDGSGETAGFVRTSEGSEPAVTSALDVSEARTWRVLDNTSGYRAPQIVEIGARSLPISCKFDLAGSLNPDTAIESIESLADNKAQLVFGNMRTRPNYTEVIFDITSGFVSGSQHEITLTVHTNDGQLLEVSGQLHVK